MTVPILSWTSLFLLAAVDALRSPKGWRAYQRYAEVFTKLDTWLTAMDPVISGPVGRHIRLPQHHFCGAVDPALAKIWSFMKSRAFCYRNAERTNRMLDLVRLRLNLADNGDQYALSIRRRLDANGGRLGVQGFIQDHNGHQSLRVQSAAGGISNLESAGDLSESHHRVSTGRDSDPAHRITRDRGDDLVATRRCG